MFHPPYGGKKLSSFAGEVRFLPCNLVSSFSLTLQEEFGYASRKQFNEMANVKALNVYAQCLRG